MFNSIRKVPYVTNNGRGGVTYFAGGFQNQLGMETQIIAILCKLLKAPTHVGLITDDGRRPLGIFRDRPSHEGAESS